MKDEGKPAIAALVGNAYRWTSGNSDVEFYFDHSHANLIPMLNMPRNQEQLQTSLNSFFGSARQPYFRVGNDPKQRDERQREADALNEVKANPKVKFVLDKFNGTIMQCQILDKE